MQNIKIPSFPFFAAFVFIALALAGAVAEGDIRIILVSLGFAIVLSILLAADALFKIANELSKVRIGSPAEKENTEKTAPNV